MHGLEVRQFSCQMLAHLVGPALFILRDSCIEALKEPARVDLLVPSLIFEDRPGIIRV
jgi:hypothetical protein